MRCSCAVGALFVRCSCAVVRSCSSRRRLCQTATIIIWLRSLHLCGSLAPGAACFSGSTPRGVCVSKHAAPLRRGWSHWEADLGDPILLDFSLLRFLIFQIHMCLKFGRTPTTVLPNSNAARVLFFSRSHTFEMRMHKAPLESPPFPPIQ